MRRSCLSGRNTKSGFTLIELLVVIAIIAILAAILFPVFARARSQAHITRCIGNMKQIGMAIKLYEDDNKGALPRAYNIWYPTANTSNNMGWYDAAGNPNWCNYFEALDKYMKAPGIAVCPAKTIEKIKDSLVGLWYVNGTKPNKTKWYGAVYTPCGYDRAVGALPSPGANSYATIKWSGQNTPRKLDSFDFDSQGASMANTVMLFCMSGTWVISWSPTNFPDKIAKGPHDRGTPALFADTHVKFVEWNRVGDL